MILMPLCKTGTGNLGDGMLVSHSLRQNPESVSALQVLRHYKVRRQKQEKTSASSTSRKGDASWIAEWLIHTQTACKWPVVGIDLVWHL